MVSNAERRRQAYPTDLEASLSDELLQFSAFLKTEFAKRSLDAATSPVAPAASPVPSVTETSLDDAEPVVTKDDDDVTLHVESLELRMYRLIVANNMEIVFPNTWIALHIYLSLMISNCSGEQSFSKLRRIKNELIRSCMTQMRLNNLTLLSVESEILRNIDVSSSIKDFALLKSRRHTPYKASTGSKN